MDTHRENEDEQKQPPHEQIMQEFIGGKDLAVPGVPVVRTNTPRPLSFVSLTTRSEHASAPESYPGSTDFPIVAPAAPPLPEELEDGVTGTQTAIAPIPLPVTSEQPAAKPPEFIWLFEYGLEMDSDYLNSPARLNGQARIYGQAVLKGYHIESLELQNGQVSVTLAKALSPEQEVWGILYRIPRRLAEQSGQEPSALDRAHAAYPFTATPAVAQEVYRKRQVQCITYMLSEAALKDQARLSPAALHLDHSYGRRLFEIARRQQLPETYLEELARLVKQDTAAPSSAAPLRAEQNTEPLPVIPRSPLLEAVPGSTQRAERTQTSNGWFFALAFYFVGLLMATLALAVIQALGYWEQVFNASFTPLGAPWYTLLYGLLGGCISGIMTLGRSTRPTLPGYVILTWFTRPYLGAVLAALAYLVLSSGLFALSIVPEQRYAIFSLVGAIAGLCEGWLLFRGK
ncbi:MAG TPA: hypothetical protein VKR83_10610 [Ktedonobacteraceae bacterium]|nr:hypothetical protein [Ktedonobacteraceae bacterium]